MAVPTLPDVKAYMGQTATSYPDASLVSALAAETAAQGRVCRVESANYPADLAEALLRRVVRNLAMRRLPLGVMADEMGSTRLGSSDPEVRRLESPFRKRFVG